MAVLKQLRAPSGTYLQLQHRRPVARRFDQFINVTRDLAATTQYTTILPLADNSVDHEVRASTCPILTLALTL